MIQHPQAVTSQPFVGRERALDELAALFAAPHVRLVTVIGPGGVGKTTLARTYTDARGASVPFV
ncbi:ATP-binding protein, partial [Deinococcus pimensis]|uniref:ATP-binding protein n=1 Tax=Deinococcus pimensis TaxID=309888 RepID=UPI0005EB622E